MSSSKGENPTPAGSAVSEADEGAAAAPLEAAPAAEPGVAEAGAAEAAPTGGAPAEPPPDPAVASEGPEEAEVPGDTAARGVESGPDETATAAAPTGEPAGNAPEEAQTSGPGDSEAADAEAAAAPATTSPPEPAPAETAPPESTGHGAAPGASEEPAAPSTPAAEAAGDPAPPATDAPAGSGEERAGSETAAKPAAPPPVPESPALREIREALEQRRPVEGRVIGWNKGGFHLAIGELAAFCPRSEMEAGEVKDPAGYLEQTLLFRVLRVQGRGRRIVVSRAAQLRAETNRQRSELRKKIQPGAVVEGTVASLTDFGAFVELGGGQGLVHVSEISHRRVEHPSAVLSEGQQVKVKVLKVEKGGRRISLSIRALEPDPWKEIAKGLEQGAVVKGRVEKANELGAFIEVAPGLTGLLPARAMSIPRETTPARAYPPGKEVSVQIISIDPRRQRISLAPEGSSLEGSRSDYKEYQRRRRQSDGEGFNALASAFRRLEKSGD